MTKKFKNLIISGDCIDVAMEFNNSYTFDKEGNRNKKNIKSKKKSFPKYQTKKKREEKRRHIYTNKKLGIISMETFLKNYLGITGEALNQMRNISHDDLLKFRFDEVKRVPSDLVDGYGSQFFYVMDSNGVKLGYYNPLEKLKITRNDELNSDKDMDEEYVDYFNRNTKGTEKGYRVEYDEEQFVYDQNDVETDLNESYNDVTKK